MSFKFDNTGSGKVTLRAADNGDYVIVFPTNDGDPGQTLTTDGDGILSWETVSDNTRVSKSGDTMSGNLNLSGYKVTGLGEPTDDTDAVNKQYIDELFGTTESAADSAERAAQIAADFDKFYHGARDTEPTSDLDVGDLWFDTNTNRMMVYSSDGWVQSTATSTGSIHPQVYNATAGQTVFSVGGDFTLAQVYVNGFKLTAGIDYTTDATSIILTAPAAAGDVVDVFAFTALATPGSYTMQQSDSLFVNVSGDTMTGPLTLNQHLTIKDDASTASAGAVRLSNSSTINWRHADNMSDLELGIDEQNNINFAGNVVYHAGIFDPSAKADASALTSHTSRLDNPHGVTKAQVGLSNVNNTSDLNKPISTATQTALDAKTNVSTSVVAGNGLSGGGDLSADRTLALGTPGTLSGTTANNVTATSHTHALSSNLKSWDAIDPVNKLSVLDGVVSGPVKFHRPAGGAVLSVSSDSASPSVSFHTGDRDARIEYSTTSGAFQFQGATTTGAFESTVGTFFRVGPTMLEYNGHQLLHSGNFDPSTKASASALTSHTSDTSNPHNVTAAQVGAAPTGRNITAGNGLSGGGTLAADRTIALGTPGTLTNSTTNNVTATSHTHAVTFPVTSVAGKTGAVTLVSGDVGLGNVDNTSDANKPVSSATQTALNLKANLASPAFTGTPTAPTQTTGNNSTRLATTAFVQTAVAGIVASAPETLDTLQELATALGNDPNFATTVSAQIGGKASTAALDAHIADTSNPHSVTKSQVGLGSVQNYSIAGAAEALAGTSHDKYMTPQRVHEAFKQFGLGVSSWSYITTDLNTLTTSGVYCISTNSDNRPTSDAAFFVWVSGYRGGNVVQQAWNFSGGNVGTDGNVYFRRMRGDVWSEWRELFHTGNFDPSAKADVSVLTSHTGDTANPHNVTAAQVGAPPTSRSITAGNGLSGGGNLTANRTITLATPGTLSGTTTNAVQASSHTHALSNNLSAWDGLATSAKADAATSITAGNGLSGGGTLAATRTLALGTPGTLSGSTTNTVTTSSHTHALSTNLSAWDALTPTAKEDAGEFQKYGLGSHNATLITSAADFEESSSNNRTEFVYTGSSSINISGETLPSWSVGVRISRNTSGHGVKILSNGTDLVFGRNALQRVWHNGNFSPDAKADSTTSITAGNGLSGGGTLAATRSITLGTPSTLSGTTTNSVSSSSHTHALSNNLSAWDGIATSTKADSTTSITAGNGLSGGGNLSANRTITLGTPGTLSGSTTNAVQATSHTHALSTNLSAWDGIAPSAKANSSHTHPASQITAGAFGAGNYSITGTFTASGNVVAYSDARLKTNVELIADALSKVEQLRGVTYDRIDTGERQTGVIAQEVQKVLPEAVVDAQTDDNVLGVAYGNMVGLLIEAVKELSEKVRQLESRQQ